MTAKAKAAPKAAPWKPVPVAVQVAAHRKAVVAARKSAAAAKAHPAAARARHVAAVKAAKTRAATAAKAKKAGKHGAPLAAGDVACCVAEALAMSLRLALDVAVDNEDVLALHWAAGGDPDAGASILDVLEATPAALSSVPAVLKYREFSAFPRAEGPSHRRFYDAVKAPQQPLILGLDLPGGKSHAVLVTPDGWWSWGDLYEPWDAPVTEAWEVSWLR